MYAPIEMNKKRKNIIKKLNEITPDISSSPRPLFVAIPSTNKKNSVIGIIANATGYKSHLIICRHVSGQQ